MSEELLYWQALNRALDAELAVVGKASLYDRAGRLQ